MGMRSIVASTVYAVDDAWCRAFLAAVGDRPGLLAFMFHAVAPDPAPGELEPLDPAQALSVEALDGFVRYFRGHGYSFVSPDDVLAGLPPSGRHVMMTFDDGYYNNVRAVPVLERHEVPAVFFISTRYVERGTSYWWDVVFRERAAAGVPLERIRAEQLSIKALRHDAVEEYLIREFGASALDPVGDDDRPLTLEELRALSRSEHVHIGNHTSDHAILTNYETSAVEEQIGGAQDVLERVTGMRPRSISYPNGNYSPDVIAATKRCGISLGLTVEPRRNSVPQGEDEMLTIGRFCFTRGHEHARTYRMFRAGASLRTGQGLARLRARFSG